MRGKEGESNTLKKKGAGLARMKPVKSESAKEGNWKHSKLAGIFSPFAVEKSPIDFPAIFNWGADDLWGQTNI